MRRGSSGIWVPLLLAVAGVTLIIVGQLDLDQPPAASLPPIPDPTSPVAVASPTPSQRATPDATATQGETPAATPSPTPVPDDWVATQIQVETVGLNVAVRQGQEPNCTYPLEDGAYIDCNASQPGRGTNSYITGHALLPIFKRLWNVQLGDEVRVLMSDGAVLQYVVTEVHPNVSCPDSNPPNPELNPE
ncbi:MAG TPA: sortase, partial [Candidatus Limnocylindria bacterium]